jgi:hypothetical protein
MRHFLLTAILLAAAQAPLPNVADLQARAVANYDHTLELRQKYICREDIESHEYDSKGTLKKTETAVHETFFVNRTAISQLISRDGKPLTPDELRKRDQSVRKAIAAAEKTGPKASNSNTPSIRDILKFGKLANERRIQVAGRPTIVFDLVPDPDKGGDIEQKIIHALEGTVSIDEATGAVQDVNAEGKRDVKVGGGMLANIHKGFRVHVILAPQPDGVWMFKLVEGKGDARVALFLNKGGDFRQVTDGCKIYDVSTTQADDKPASPPQ